ncbi:MAG: OmpA family protein [Planctomycetes bacterium]|nr:OmpA family protein [Planctomycetota bacterium]
MSKNNQPQVDDSGPSVPAYIVTFSDMVTLLLTFFVMLLSLANAQDPKLVNRGKDAFFRSIMGLGIGLGQGEKIKSELSQKQSYHRTDLDDASSPNRLLDAEEEKIRRLFRKISKSMQAIPSQITSNETAFSPTNIKFANNSYELDSNSANILNVFCSGLKQSQSKNITLCVIGLANDAKTEKQRWMLSAKRAQMVSNLLKKILKEQKLDYLVYNWGAGDGGQWTNKDNPFSKELQILVTILRTNY